MSSSSSSDSSFLAFLSSFAGDPPAGAAEPEPAAAGAAATAAPPEGTEANFSEPFLITSSMSLPLSSLMTFSALAASSSTPTEPRIFLRSSVDGFLLPPRMAKR